METLLDKARKDVRNCKYKAAVKNLKKVQEAVVNGHADLAPQLLELATTIQEQSIGRVRDDAGELVQSARSVLEAAEVQA
jgi:ribosomal protein S20